MIVGILTFHRAYNIGATLQAYALTRYIKSELCDVELVDFLPNNAVSKKRTVIREIMHFGKSILYYNDFRNDRAKMKLFHKFWKEHYVLSKNQYFGDNDIFNQVLPYDVLISGSDQILNVTLTGNTKSYYLSFGKNKKKISYASSFGREVITDLEHALIKSELIQFSSISVREKSALSIIENDIGIRPELVVDPVFLITKDQWLRLKSTLSKKNYIFVYVMEYTPQFEKAINYYKSLYNLPIITVCGNRSIKVPGKKVRACGPSEFISYINNAELVITNSFHGTAMSIILEKKSVIIGHSSKNTRIANIMEMADAENKIVYNESDLSVDKVLDGADAYKKIEKAIIKSKEYLRINIDA